MINNDQIVKRLMLKLSDMADSLIMPTFGSLTDVGVSSALACEFYKIAYGEYPDIRYGRELGEFIKFRLKEDGFEV